MDRLIIIFGLLFTVECASYQRYDSSTRYPIYSSTYSAYSTISSQYNQFPYKGPNYGSDISSFPDATRYPNYNSASSSYSSGSGYYQPSYTTPGYDYGQNYGQGYGQGYGGEYNSFEMAFMRNDIKDACMNRSPQVDISVESLMGMWYGVEIVHHLAGDPRVDRTRTCVVMHISEPQDPPSTENQLYHVQHINAKFRHEYRHLRLLWDEAGNTTEFTLYFRNDTAGYWQVYDKQNGTMTTRPQYNQFKGSVQVLKAVNDHLVLNFCQPEKIGASRRNMPQLYSVLFSRDPGNIAQWEIESVHNMLQNKKLSIASRRLVCGNSAHRVNSVIFLIVSSLFAYVVNSA